MYRFALLRAAILSAALCLGTGALAAPPGKNLFARGQALAKDNCGRCHAVGRSGESANPASPPFRHLARKYPLSNLEEALGEGIVVGHEGVDMPPFRFSSAQIEALLTYLGAIQKK